MINPVNHANGGGVRPTRSSPTSSPRTSTPLPPHIGRGGWTWYTGSAGWMYQFILESLLGLKVEADKLHFVPCAPAHWNSFQVHYRYRDTVYHITVLQTSLADGEPKLTVDGGVPRPGHSFG